MNVEKLSQPLNEEITSILKRGEIADKKAVLSAIQQSKTVIYKMSLKALEKDLMCFLMPCIKKIFIEIYNENSNINSKEQLMELMDNLEICITLTDFIGYIIEMVSSYQGDANIVMFESIIVEISRCFYLTYKHCKESQIKYQSLTEECKEIKELYKRNQDFYLQFLNVLNNLEIPGSSEAATILMQAQESIMNIIKILFGINMKALADSWKAYCNILEKHSNILSAENYYCVSEIECLTEQIQSFINIGLENNDEQKSLNSIKFSGFLLKVALKIISEYWEQLHHEYSHIIHKFLCSVYDYSIDTLGKWNMKVETQNCIQNYLFGVITPFVLEKILCENFLQQHFLNILEANNKISGCVIFDLKILKYLLILPKNSIDYIPFNDYLNHIFHHVSMCFPEYSNPAETGNSLFDNLTFTIAECIIHHSKFYNKELEQIFVHNILGNDLWCHLFACEIWTRILRFASANTKKNVVLGFMELIDSLKIDSTFTSYKILFLNRFLENLFNILSEEELNCALETYPPYNYPHIWRLIGFKNISFNQKSYLDPFLNSFVVEMDNSSDDIIGILDSLKLISTADFFLLGTKGEVIITNILKLWRFNCAVVNLDNAFFKFLISNLCYATTSLVKIFSNDQILTILKNMKELLKTPFFQLQMCELLKAISSRPIELNSVQNTLNSVLSDIFKILLMEKNEVVKGISLETLQQFAVNDYYVVVNNVARMLPYLNLEQYLEDITNEFHLTNCIKALEILPLEHKCLAQFCKEIQSVVPQKKPLETEPSLHQVFSRNPGENVGTNFNRTSSNKRIKLLENSQDEDSVEEVLERIKSEIKCLTKVLLTEKLTLKNAQKIKMLSGQLENTVCQN